MRVEEYLSEPENVKKVKERLFNFVTSLDYPRLCVECDQPVDITNDVAVYDFINSLGADWLTAVSPTPKHLEPQELNGAINCAGSRSRWAAISGLPDDRPEYSDITQDPAAGLIWNIMQTLQPPTDYPKIADETQL